MPVFIVTPAFFIGGGGQYGERPSPVGKRGTDVCGRIEEVSPNPMRNG